MYYEHFGLKEPPFKITPNTEMFFTGGNRGAILDAITYAILNGEGIIKVVGEVGSGKTMLCRMLQTMLPKRVESIYLANPSVAPEDVLHAIAFELQLRLPKGADRLKVMQALQKHLLKRHAAGKQVVIFVEEAQGMPLATLEEIRLLSNLETNHDKLLQIVLFGQPELDENLNETNIRQLRERITHSFNLAPLHAKEIGEYLMFRLRSAGYSGPPPFTAAAVKKLSNAAQGLVRRVNILAEKSLLAAFADNAYEVTPKHVQAAISDSEFGQEKSRAAVKASKFLMWAAILGLGLVLGYLVSDWYQERGHVNIAAVNTGGNGTEATATTIEAAASNKPVANVERSLAEGVLEINADQLSDVDAEPSLAVSAQQDLFSLRYNATNAWLKSQPPSTVTIQLMGSNNDVQITSDLEMLSQQLPVDNIYVYRTLVNGRIYVNILYGSFKDRANAVQALKRLPAYLLKNKPQLRTIAGVLQEMKQLPELR